eukprot:CAMPEP_0206445124 /NCGR_PEP_ID=MMETSP0324_2-20121206/15313_1 /ASSEMBLY_ACC=CAM_ASM_000836 /TAXON_ID=2866 /ORGANISM="Crypthecodinium cohnii, Strain Seligo" /LENGTH=455 /DNA_ID=CAMNT_0053913263 /DNA_START=78 /DNA_END=1445 /DNA_ORIENTATION=+
MSSVTYSDGDLATYAAQITAQKAALDSMEAGYAESLDTIWMLLASLLVFFMHAGFSLLEAGSVRRKNTQNILAKNLCVVVVGFMCWWFVGYSFAFGVAEDNNKFIGHNNFAAGGFWAAPETFRFWLFQGAFCATGATIVSGAMAERTELKGFAIFVVFMTSWIYPVVVYWVWSGAGILNYTDDEGNVGAANGPSLIDFAGSGVVHLVGGIGAIAGAIIVGPRKDRWAAHLVDSFDGHSIPFCVLGTFCLWFGWYGFNPGSTGSMHDKETAYTAGIVAVNTTLAPCVAGLVVFAIRAFLLPPKCLDVGGFCNGILAGLVSITAGCAVVEPWEAIVIGLIGGLCYCGASFGLTLVKVDDVVDAFPVHGVCGFWGVLSCGLFGDPENDMGGNGLFYGGDQLRVQLLGLVMIIAWTLAWSVAIFFPLKALGLLRLSDEFQDKGADVMEHSPAKAYSHAP